jgi:hypothetical protein
MLEPRKRSLGWIVAPSHDLVDRVFRRIVEIAETHLKHRVREISPREQRIVITNLGGGTSEVRGKSADRPYSLLGEGLDWMVADEAAQLSRDVWDEYLSQRLVDRRGWALLISTPKGPGWFFRMYRRGLKGKDSDYESWSLPSITNPYLDAATIEGERARLSGDTYRQEYLGEFIGVRGEACDVCGGPSANVSGWIVIQLGDLIPTCSECDRPVDGNGMTVVGLDCNGQPRLTVIEESGIDETPEPIGDELVDAPTSSPPTAPELPRPTAIAPPAPRFVPGPIRGWGDYDD